MSDLRTIDLKLPASTEDLAKLRLGDVVYLTGRVFTAREGVYKRAVEDGAGLRPAARDGLGQLPTVRPPPASKRTAATTSAPSRPRRRSVSTSG